MSFPSYCHGIVMRLQCVVVALRVAIEALAELSDSTGVGFIDDTFDAPREGNNDLTK